MEAKRAIVEERAAEVHDVCLDDYDDDGAWIHLAYSATVETDKVATAVQLAEQIVAEVEGAAEMRLGAELWEPQERGEREGLYPTDGSADPSEDRLSKRKVQPRQA